MLERLRAWIHDLDEPSGIGFRIDALHWQETDLRVRLTPTDSEGYEREMPPWFVVCRDVHDVQIRDRSGDFELLSRESPAVRQFLDPQVDLTFNGATAEPGAIAWRLREAHRAVAHPWIDFEKYLNPRLGVQELLTGRFGMLADGPEFVVRALKQVLDDVGIAAALGDPRPAVSWVDGAWRPTRRDLRGLAIGRSIIVAAGFAEVDAIDGE